MRPVLLRVLASAVLLAGVWVSNIVLTQSAAVVSGDVAGAQFDNSNIAAVQSVTAGRLLGQAALPLAVTLLLLATIWWPYLRRLAGRPLAVGIALLAATSPARAYYDKNDYTETYFILPNESAFFLPDSGANQDRQARFGSEAYLDANKVPAKRFVIPHAKLVGSSLWSDYYVPTGRLIIVDRTPYNREWTAAQSRGTSSRNESFPCQSKEGLNVTAEVAIAASVSEDNAARFLYFFGVKPPQGNRADPQVIFTSVYYGRSLAEVMDAVGRGKVQSLVCHEVGTRTLDEVNASINAIMDSVEKGAGQFFAGRGITLDYIGWAGTLTFDKDVQQAINDRYEADKILPVLDTLRTKAALDAAGRWDGHLPGSVSGLWLLPTDLTNGLSSWLAQKPPTAK